MANLRESLSLLEDDLRHGRFERLNHDMNAVYWKAEALFEKYACTTGARTLDILHVAAALELGSARFVSLDQRQRAIARKAGLDVIPRR